MRTLILCLCFIVAISTALAQKATLVQRVFLIDVYKSEIGVIDPAASTFIDSLPAQADHGAIMTSDGKIYFIDDNHLISLDATTGQRITLTALQNVAGIHGMRPVLFGVTPDSQRIVVAHIKIDPDGTGSGPERIMFWLSIHDARTGTFLRNIPSEPEHAKTSQDDACAAPQMIFASDNRTMIDQSRTSEAGPPQASLYVLETDSLRVSTAPGA